MHNKATNLAGYQEAQKRMESYQKWHDIVKKECNLYSTETVR